MSPRCIALGLTFLTACGARTSLEVEPAADASVDAPPPLVCAPLARARPQIVLVLDRSGSMGRRLGPEGTTRTSALRAAIDAVLPSLDEAGLGAVLYPVADASTDAGTVCSLAPTALDVPIAQSNAEAVLAAYDAHPPAGGTPTAEALRRAYEALAPASAAFAPAVVLATDGGPNCNPDDADEAWYGLAPEFCSQRGLDTDVCLDDERTVEVIAQARARGIPTYVVGIDVALEPLVQALDAMAVAGGRARSGDTRFYDAERPDDVRAGLIEIVDDVSRCAYVSDRPLDPQGDVFVDGQRTLEWDRAGNGIIELHGEACERALQPGVAVTFGRCGG